jgi:hypothetical protein
MYPPLSHAAWLTLILAIYPADKGLGDDPHTQDVYSLGDQATAELRMQPSPHFVVQGIPELANSKLADPKPNNTEDWSQLGAKYFSVTTYSEHLASPPALLGDYRSASQGCLEFIPRFPLSRSVTYQLHIEPGLAAHLSQNSSTGEKFLFRLPPPPPTAPARVEAVYPSASELPENLLKFYIHFSAPMSRGEAYQRVRLFQGDELIDQPFLELGEELWNPEQTRFTLFIHPGRIKQGLLPREQSGPAMAAGKSYRLRIDSQWRDANGHAMIQNYEKQFVVLPPDDQQVDPQQWQIETPPSESLAPVKLNFNEALDHAMLSRVLVVKDAQGEPIPGTIEIVDAERQWLFRPRLPWPTGTYMIQVATNLEDLCGNSIARPFEVKMQDRAASQPTALIAIEFVVN